MYYGFESAVTQIMLELDLIYARFFNAFEENRDVSDSIKTEKYIEIVDMSSVFFTNIMKGFTEYTINYSLDFIDSVKSYDTLDLVIFILVIFVVFMIILRLFVIQFKDSIMRVKRMLGIMPTKFIARDLNNVKIAMAQIS